MGYKLVRREGKAGDLIERHNHPEAEVIVTVVKGRVKAAVAEKEHDLVPGEILTFDGNDYINAEFIEDGLFFVTLVLK